MRRRCLIATIAAFAVTAPGQRRPAQRTPPAGKPAACRAVTVEGEVRAGQRYRALVLQGVELQLEPAASGWVLRVVPVTQPGEDWAEMATPPYRSVTPLAVSTDWGFRAQDAVGWNPRRFRFAQNQTAYASLRALRQAVEAGQTGKVAALADLASQQPGGKLQILDAHLVPGTADQARAASLLAGHFATTAHALEQPAGGHPTPLGAITWMRFRISLELPPGEKAAAGRKVQRGDACGGG